jgi:tetratricopeptide (TPR) repeat protein
MIRAILLFFIGFSFSWQNLAAAGFKWAENPQILPQYCKDMAKGNQTAAAKRWHLTLGKTFYSMHHYCNGVYAEHKARGSLDKQKRDHWLGLVEHEMRYVSNRCETGCVLYPELHTRWGWALGEKGQVADAIQHYQLAIRAKPKYMAPYARLSDLYVKLNQPDEARKVLESGLRAKPGSSMLQRRLQKLGTPE